ncbi:SixA phosphatase family protein [Dokdonia sp. Hel_I_53]|uniref:SixA phosphatase family protein n=1 Tax=Dokdonia sp. Hel_I_53 TaxID=1566287 RepID=UPI001199F9A6|nr:histidine phosphatase family protein [Dokdonia sp. Hel_I_53]TVZ51152.1 phosphohistidine phosphatase [Dokdonia sp. Hel_I_53]
MKTLYLVRHAKSSWKFDVIDHERPLNERGLSDAPKVASHVASVMQKPDVIMSSDALRARTTAVFFAQAYNISDTAIILNHKMYDFAGMDLVEVIKACDDAYNHVMMFGHNNAITNFVNTYGSKQVDNVPTAGFTALEFSIDSWKDLKPGKTIYSKTPKELR